MEFEVWGVECGVLGVGVGCGVECVQENAEIYKYRIAQRHIEIGAQIHNTREGTISNTHTNIKHTHGAPHSPDSFPDVRVLAGLIEGRCAGPCARPMTGRPSRYQICCYLLDLKTPTFKTRCFFIDVL